MKKTFKAAIVLILAMMTLCVMTVPALADNKPSIYPVTMWEGQNETFALSLNNMPENAKFVSIKSSKPKIVEAGGKSLDDLYVKGLKAGSSKITVKYKYKGKTKSISTTITVHKYSQFLKSLKVNGKSVNLKKNKYSVTFNKLFSANKDTKLTIKFKVYSGWTVKSSYLFINYDEYMPFENGKPVIIPKGATAYAVLLMQDKKGNDLHYTIWMN